MANIFPGNSITAHIAFQYRGPADNLIARWWIWDGLNPAKVAVGGVNRVAVSESTSFVPATVSVGIPGTATASIPVGSYIARVQIVTGDGATQLGLTDYPVGTINVLTPVLSPEVTGLAITSFT